MDNEFRLDYKGYSIYIYRANKKVWHVTATHADEPQITRVGGGSRDELVDAVQYLIDLAVAGKDPDVQVSKRGLWNWLEK